MLGVLPTAACAQPSFAGPVVGGTSYGFLRLNSIRATGVGRPELCEQRHDGPSRPVRVSVLTSFITTSSNPR